MVRHVGEPTGSILTGKLKPSTRLMSWVSGTPPPGNVNSTRVAGGTPVAPLHSPPPWPQSPVTHLSVQNVLAHILADFTGTVNSISFDAFEGSSNPVVDGAPVFAYAAGQIVSGQLFMTVNVADSPPESVQF